MEPEKWFEWTANEREQYVKGFNKLTIDDVVAKKKVEIKQDSRQDEPTEWLEFPDVITSLYTTQELTNGLICTIIKEAEKLFNSPNAIKSVPSLNVNPV